MSSIFLILLGAGLAALSGFPALFMPASSVAGQRLSAWTLAAGSAAGAAGAILALLSPSVPALFLPWALPLGAFSVSADPLSAFFLLPVFIVPALGAVYGLGYWKQAEHQEDGRMLGLFYGLLAGGMATVVIARDAILFLVAWEVMALSAYFAASADGDKEEVRKAGWVYLVATHAGTLILIAMFALWRRETGSFALDAAQGVTAAASGSIFLLAVLGFGFKAGFMPLHVWLPGAHANAPSHVSAVMSGVMLKMGVYGIMRVSGLLGACEPWWGYVLLIVGALSAVLGIAFSCVQRDLKRVLAYSSVENLGIVGLGLGLGLLGLAYGRNELVLLGAGGALLHVWNHGLFKSLLFLGSGAVIHGTGTRDIERMGGLAKRMPVSAFLFVFGAAAICALPPLNGFASEWLLYLGLFKAIDPANAAGLALSGCAAIALAATGALAVAAFSRLCGVVFLGSPRAKLIGRAHDPGPSMLVPMIILASGCVFIGVAPGLLAPALEKALRAWAPSVDQGLSLAGLANQGLTGIIGAGVAVAAVAAALIAMAKRKGKKTAAGPTWDCGYAEPTPRMQYTGSSISQNLAGIFSFALRPEARLRKPASHFPAKSDFDEKVPDPALDRAVLPLFGFLGARLSKLRFLQHGQTNLYVLYVALIAIALFAFSVLGAAL